MPGLDGSGESRRRCPCVLLIICRFRFSQLYARRRGYVHLRKRKYSEISVVHRCVQLIPSHTDTFIRCTHLCTSDTWTLEPRVQLRLSPPKKRRRRTEFRVGSGTARIFLHSILLLKYQSLSCPIKNRILPIILPPTPLTTLFLNTSYLLTITLLLFFFLTS